MALTKEQLEHSDRILVKVSPLEAAESMSVFVESFLSRGDDRLGQAAVESDSATYTYCAAREANHAVAPCKRTLLKKDEMKNMLLRVTLAPKHGHTERMVRYLI